MLHLFKRKGPTASEIGTLGNMVRRDREREAYKRFHDAMAARVGTTIRWAR